MAVIKMNLLTALERFPDHRETIKKLFLKDESFKILCEDYGRCAEALRYWSQSSSKEAGERSRGVHCASGGAGMGDSAEPG